MKAAAQAALLALLVFAPVAVAGAQPAHAPDPIAQQKALQHYRQGQTLLLHDDYAPAADEFRAALALDATLALAHYGLGQSAMGLRDYESAVQAFLACRAAYRDLAASAFQRNERVDRWIEDEVRALRDVQQQIEARLRLGAADPRLQQELTRVTSRLEQLDRLKQRGDGPASEPPGVALALGSAYLRGGHLAEAEREYQLALQGNPKMGEAHNNLAYVYMVTGRLPEADKALKQAARCGFRVNPEFKAELEQKLK